MIFKLFFSPLGREILFIDRVQEANCKCLASRLFSCFLQQAVIACSFPLFLDVNSFSVITETFPLRVRIVSNYSYSTKLALLAEFSCTRAITLTLNSVNLNSFYFELLTHSGCTGLLSVLQQRWC